MWRWSRKDYKLENQTCLHYVPIDVTSAAIQTLNLVVGYLHKYCATHALTLKLTNQYATISLTEVNSDFKEVMFNSLRLFTLAKSNVHAPTGADTHCTYSARKMKRENKQETKKLVFSNYRNINMCIITIHTYNTKWGRSHIIVYMAQSASSYFQWKEKNKEKLQLYRDV